MTILPKRQAGAASGGGAGGGGGREEAEQDHGAGAYQISSQVGIYETSNLFLACLAPSGDVQFRAGNL